MTHESGSWGTLANSRHSLWSRQAQNILLSGEYMWLDGVASTQPYPIEHSRRFFSGVSKVLPMMRWAVEAADIPIRLPDDLPQFNEHVG